MKKIFCVLFLFIYIVFSSPEMIMLSQRLAITSTLFPYALTGTVSAISIFLVGLFLVCDRVSIQNQSAQVALFILNVLLMLIILFYILRWCGILQFFVPVFISTLPTWAVSILALLSGMLTAIVKEIRSNR